METQHSTCRSGFIHSGHIGAGFEAETRQFVTSDGYLHELDERGFRLTPRELDGRALRLLIIGCSFAFGYGLSYEKTAGYQVAQLLRRIVGRPVTTINLSVPGTSNDYISRQLVECIEGVRPDLVFIAFTQASRVEYWVSMQKRYTIRPGAPRKAEWSSLRLSLQSKCEALEGHPNDLARLYRSIRTCSLTCRAFRIPFYYTYATYRRPPEIQACLPEEEYVGIVFPRIDFAGDGLHPGPESNRVLALCTVAKMVHSRFQNRGRRIQRLFRLKVGTGSPSSNLTTWVYRPRTAITVRERP